MTPAKRLLDIVLALALGILTLPLLAAAIPLLLAFQGRAVFYGSERMQTPDRAFTLWKLRTMTPALSDSGVSGGDKSARITTVGGFLRRYRLDEVPQLWNILRGDMSFVGPRPPLRQYVDRFPQLYARVLACRPGVTGLASLHFHAHEEWLLRRCRSAAETDAVYTRNCIPRKARLDMIYAGHRNSCLDLAILGQTLARVVRRRQRARPGKSR